MEVPFNIITTKTQRNERPEHGRHMGRMLGLNLPSGGPQLASKESLGCEVNSFMPYANN